MAHSFSELRKNKAASFEAVNKAVEKLSSGSKSKSDERFWQPTVDKVGNGYAVVRFLPAPVGEDDPFIRRWDHGFQGPGGWYIENSLTTLGQDDPVGELNSKLWNQSKDDESPGRKQARAQKRRLHYISNILVVEDPGNKDNNGKVFLYKYGKKIFDKLNDLMNPKFQDEQARNPFDPDEGVNFKIKIRQVEGYRNYDKSEFEDTPSPIAEDDEKAEAIWRQEYSLKEFMDAKHFKSYDELKRKLAKVLGEPGQSAEPGEERKETAAPKQKEAAAPRQAEAAPTAAADDEDDGDGLEFFQKLAQKN